MIIKHKKIAIIGGGPGGLTLARLLQMGGATVKVYERDPSRNIRVQGATLDLHAESGLLALDKARLMDAFKQKYRPGADRMTVTDRNAIVRFEEEIEMDFSDHKYFRPEIDRGPLRDLLLDSLAPGTVIWDSQFQSLERDDKGITLNFKNGGKVMADLVIAADGANSRVRPYITQINPFYTGYTVVEGAVNQSEANSPNIHRLLKGGKIFALGNERSLVVSSKGDGSLVFYVTFKADENWTKASDIDFNNEDDVHRWFNTEFNSWGDVWSELLINATGGFVPRPLYCMPFNQQWETQADLTLLGDAAHLMPPFAGEGVNMAMLDAVRLADCLLGNRFDNVKDAITAYEKEMVERGARVGRESMEQTVAIHAPDGLEYLLQFFGGHR